MQTSASQSGTSIFLGPHDPPSPEAQQSIGLTNKPNSFRRFYLFLSTLLHSLLSPEEKPPTAPDGRSASGCQVWLSVTDLKCQCEAELMRSAKSVKQRLKISSIWQHWGQHSGQPCQAPTCCCSPHLIHISEGQNFTIYRMSAEERHHQLSTSWEL